MLEPEEFTTFLGSKLASDTKVIPDRFFYMIKALQSGTRMSDFILLLNLSIKVSPATAPICVNQEAGLN